jgi:hypothetical protein
MGKGTELYPVATMYFCIYYYGAAMQQHIGLVEETGFMEYEDKLQLEGWLHE